MAEPENKKATFGLDENIASALSYLLIWITGLIFYLLEKENKVVRFHAMQSIITFLPLQVVYWILVYVFWWNEITYFLSMLVVLLIFILWIVLMIKAYQGEMYKLPVVGDIAYNATK